MRTAILILFCLARAAHWLLEQPGSSKLKELPHYQLIAKLLKKILGESQYTRLPEPWSVVNTNHDLSCATELDGVLGGPIAQSQLRAGLPAWALAFPERSERSNRSRLWTAVLRRKLSKAKRAKLDSSGNVIRRVSQNGKISVSGPHKSSRCSAHR